MKKKPLNKKKILIISWSDLYGGAARACYQTYQSLKSYKNIDLFVQKKISIDKKVKTYKSQTINLLIRRYFSLIAYKLRFSKHDYSYNLIKSDILKKADVDKYDILNIHWINSETLSLFDLIKIKQKVVMTLHDMWAFCGSEHYLYNKPSLYFKNGKKIKIFFLDKLIWSIKKKLWKKNFYIVTPSKWLSKLAKESHVMSNFLIRTIPYSVNQKVFKKEKICNLRINGHILKKKKNIIDLLFLSAGKLNNYRKGFDLLYAAIQQDNEKNNYRLILAGNFKVPDFIKINSNCIVLGSVDNEKIKSNLYNFVDLVVLPSRIDNLPNVGLEAHSCGKPIVAFHVGGIPEIISHKKTGYLAEPYSLIDFMKGIKFVNKYKRKLSINSINKSRLWDPIRISKKYVSLFNSI